MAKLNVMVSQLNIYIYYISYIPNIKLYKIAILIHNYFDDLVAPLFNTLITNTMEY